jgi:hypothetical protein
VCRMSVRGLVVALLCGVLGLVGGAAVAYAVQPRTSYTGAATPMPATSPSLPIDVETVAPYAKDIDYPALEPGFALNVVHTFTNDLARWTFHVPQGWQAYAVCGEPEPCAPPLVDNAPIRPAQVDGTTQARFRPVGEPTTGGYSLRVRIISNTFVDVHQTVATKIVGFGDSPDVVDYSVLNQTDSAVSFEYRDATTNYHRFNYFQWFAVPGHTNATLEMSVSGRARDRAGLRWLFDRFADNVMGRLPPTEPPKGKQQEKQKQR